MALPSGPKRAWPLIGELQNGSTFTVSSTGAVNILPALTSGGQAYLSVIVQNVTASTVGFSLLGTSTGTYGQGLVLEKGDVVTFSGPVPKTIWAIAQSTDASAVVQVIK